MSIDRDAIRRLERLAGLALTGKERTAMAAHLSRVVEYFRTIQTIDIRNAPPYAGPAPVLREDVVEPGLDITAAIGESPETDEDFLVVPPPFERGDSDS